VENHEALETSAVISQLADAVQNQVNDLLADRVVTTSIVVGGILLARNQLLRVVQLAVSSSADFIDHTRLEIKVYATRNVLASTCLRKEGVEGVIATTNGLVGGHLTIRLDAVLKAQKLPAPVASLNSGLTNVNR
jgi:hypothetical protein